MLEQHQALLAVATHGRGLVDITSQVRACLAGSGIRAGLLT